MPWLNVLRQAWVALKHRNLDTVGVGLDQDTVRPEVEAESPAERRYKQESEGALQDKPVFYVSKTWRW